MGATCPGALAVSPACDCTDAGSIYGSGVARVCPPPPNKLSSPPSKGDRLLSPPPKKLDATLSTVLPTEDPLLPFVPVFCVTACVLSCRALICDCWIDVRLVICVVSEVNCSVTSELLP